VDAFGAQMAAFAAADGTGTWLERVQHGLGGGCA
jgi:hypothetical protein